MKRYGDNLHPSQLEESQRESGEKTQYLAGNCAVRQDMLSFLMPANPPSDSKNHKPWNIFSFFRFGQKQIQKNSN